MGVATVLDTPTEVLTNGTAVDNGGTEGRKVDGNEKVGIIPELVPDWEIGSGTLQVAGMGYGMGTLGYGKYTNGLIPGSAMLGYSPAVSGQ